MGPRIIAAAIGLLAIVVTAHGLVRWPLYPAEVWTWQQTNGDAAELLRMIRLDKHPPLHPALVWLVRCLVDSPEAGRVWSGLGGLGAVAGTAAAIHRLLDVRWATLGALVVVVSPCWINNIGVLRPYALMMGVGAGLVWAATQARTSPNHSAVALAILGTVSLYLHYAQGAILGSATLAAIAGALTRADRSRAVVKILLANAAVVIALSPWMLGTGGGQLGRSTWSTPSMLVFRYLTFEVDEFSSFGSALLLGLAAIGVLAVIRGRVWEMAAAIVGAVVLPWMMSASGEVTLRVYALAGLLPVVVILAAYGARLILPRPLVWGAIVLAVMGPEAWAVLRLPSAPFGRHRTGFDDGRHDTARDIAVLTEALPPDARLTAPRTEEPSLPAFYGPSVVLRSTPGDRHPTDWRLLKRPQRKQPQGAPGCLLNDAFALSLHLPDAESCQRVLDELARADHPPWLLERAQQTPDPAVRTQLLKTAVEQSATTATPHIMLTEDHLSRGDTPAAAALIQAGLWRSLRWKEIGTAAALLRLRAQIRPDQAAADQAAATCLEGARPTVWLPHRCLWSVTAQTVSPAPAPKQPPRPPRRDR